MREKERKSERKRECIWKECLREKKKECTSKEYKKKKREFMCKKKKLYKKGVWKKIFAKKECEREGECQRKKIVCTRTDCVRERKRK